MGFELNRIMKQYGVGTPTMASYSGTAVPGEQPAAPKLEQPVTNANGVITKALTKAQIAANTEATDKYNKDLADWNETMRKYQLDTKSYDTYKNDYQNRLQNTPMYLQSQFDTGSRPVSAAMNWATTGDKDVTTGRNMGAEQYAQNIRNYAADHPYASTQNLQDEMKKYGISGQDVYGATGSYWGNQTQNPTYGAVPLSLANQTAQNKADYYLQQRGLGYTDADLRGATTKTFGAPKEADWTELLNRAYPQYVKNVNDAYGTIGRSGFGSDASNIDNAGYNYWMNQLSSGAVKPEDLTSRVQQAAIDNGSWKPATTVTADTSNVSGTTNTGNTNTVTANANWLYNTLNAYSDPSDVANAYSQWINANGGDTAANQAAATDYLKNLGISTDTINSAYSNYLNSLNPSGAGYAHGGKVKTHYQTAGSVRLPSGYSDAENEAEWVNRWASQQVPVEVNPINSDTAPAPVTLAAAPVTEVVAPKSVLTDIAVDNAKNASEPLAPAVVAEPTVKTTVAKPPMPFGDERMANIQALLSAYGPQGDTYGPELKLARERAKKESDAFSSMLEKAMASPENEQASKAEMYFRLAAAFGSPTKTGHFTENLGMVGKELGEYAKGKREASKEKLALALKGQELRMGAAKEDLATLRSLSAEEMKDKRTIAQELIKDYIKSGEPQSAAGKQALDEGLKPGTPEYQKRVAAIGNMNVEGKMAQINATLANLSIAQANLALRQQNAAKLSGPELTLKRETEDTVATIKQSLGDLKQAYALNPNSLAGGWMDKGQQWLAEAAGSKDPTIVNTRILNNLLGAQGLAKLKTTFGGNPTEGERAILLELEGIGSKTKEERGAIIRRTYKVLQEKQAREQRRLDDINSGAYRMTTPIEGGSE